MFEPCSVATLVLFGVSTSSFEISTTWRLMLFDAHSIHVWTTYGTIKTRAFKKLKRQMAPKFVGSGFIAL